MEAEKTSLSATIIIPAPWSELLPDILGRVIAHLLFPADRARFRVICRAWRSAAHQHVSQVPWIVLPDCSFCTIGDDGAFFPRIPGLPENNVTCLGAAADGWLALDCTDDVFRRTLFWASYDFINHTLAKPRPHVRHRHAYLLHNPFSGETVPLPELDSVFGNVPETFQIRKVLMMRSSGGNPKDDVVAVITNNWKYNLVLCCRGKTWIPRCCLRIFDVAFLGDRLYGINPEEELIAFDLVYDDNGVPTVDKYRRVIKKPLADGEVDPWTWMYDEEEVEEEEAAEEEEVEEEEEEVEEEDDEEEDESSEDNDSSTVNKEDSFNNDLHAPDGKHMTPYETNKGHIVTTRHLVTSHGGRELLMVRHQKQSPPFFNSYTLKVEVFKADMNAGKWVPVTTDALEKGETLFLGHYFSKSTRAYGDIKEGFVYFLDETDDVFDTNSWACRPFSLPRKTKPEAQELLTWLLPPELVLV
ncbi:hypothetical protein QOZ80_8BG0642080 [Eleusine coracana subsp. coracana]|nr:hypothetical protein QOZ80_8BG0642080 [Eleusine coracana subsp. coracana]